MQRSTLAKRAWLLIFLVVPVFYFYGLGRMPFIGPDEPRYAQIAREMLTRADLITPTLGGHPWFEKPALLYWMIMAGFASFGVTEWAARVGPALSGVLTILLVYLLGQRIERESADEETRGLGPWSGACLASSAGLIIFARAVTFDIVVTMTLTAALVCFLMGELSSTESRRRLWLAGFYGAMGASLLAKGLIGIVIPAGVVAAYFLLRREWPKPGALKSLLWGVPLTLLLALVWYGPVTYRNGWTFIDQFIIQHHFARYVSNKYQHPQPFYFYLPMMALFIMPWTAFLLAALVRIKQRGLRANDAVGKMRAFALCWMVVPIAFFSLSGSKLPGYILPALPGAALLVGQQLSLLTVNKRSRLWPMRATGVLSLLLSVTIAIYLARGVVTGTGIALAVALPFGLAGAFALLSPNRRRVSAALTIAAMFAATVLAINLILEQGTRRESVRELLAAATARGYASAPIFEFYVRERTAEFYGAGRLEREPGGDVRWFNGALEIADEAQRKGGTALVIVPLDGVNQLTNYARLQTEIIGDNGDVALVAVRVR